MLKSFRTNNNVRNGIIIFVTILLASYVLVGFGSAPPKAQGDTIATLGSTKVKLRDVWIQVANLRNTFRQADTAMVNQFAVNQVFNEALLIDRADQLDITVSDAELRDFVIRSRTMEDGKFIDDEEWSLRIRNFYKVQVDSFEEYTRNNSLKVQKYRSLFYDSAYVSEEDILKRFKEKSQQAKLEMITLNTFEVRDQVKLEKDEDIQKLIDANPEAFLTGKTRQVRFLAVPFNDFRENVEVSDAEIEENYSANMQRYQQPEQVKASHILIKPEGRTDDEAKVLADKLYKELLDGADFAEYAKKFSEDESNKNRGGDLGAFPRGRMVKPFEDAAYDMEIDTLSPPIKTQFGYHIIKKIAHTEATTSPLEQVKGAIKASIERTKSKDKALQVVKEFHGLLENMDFQEAAKQVAGGAYAVQESSFFDEDRRSNLGDVLKNNFQARRAAFELAELNAYTEPMTLGQDAVVMQWVAEGEPRTLNMSDDAQRVRQLAQDVAGKVFIKKELEAIRAAALKSPDKSLKDLRGNREFLKDNHFKTTSWVNATSVPFEIRSDDLDFVEDIYSLEEGQFLPELDTSADTRFVLARVIEKQAADMTKLEEERYALIEQVRSENAADLMGAYVYALQQEYDPDNKVRDKITGSLTRR